MFLLILMKTSRLKHLRKQLFSLYHQHHVVFLLSRRLVKNHKNHSAAFPLFNPTKAHFVFLKKWRLYINNKYCLSGRQKLATLLRRKKSPHTKKLLTVTHSRSQNKSKKFTNIQQPEDEFPLAPISRYANRWLNFLSNTRASTAIKIAKIHRKSPHFVLLKSKRKARKQKQSPEVLLKKKYFEQTSLQRTILRQKRKALRKRVFGSSRCSIKKGLKTAVRIRMLLQNTHRLYKRTAKTSRFTPTKQSKLRRLCPQRNRVTFPFFVSKGYNTKIQKSCFLKLVKNRGIITPYLHTTVVRSIYPLRSAIVTKRKQTCAPLLLLQKISSTQKKRQNVFRQALYKNITDNLSKTRLAFLYSARHLLPKKSFIEKSRVSRFIKRSVLRPIISSTTNAKKKLQFFLREASLKLLKNKKISTVLTNNLPWFNFLPKTHNTKLSRFLRRLDNFSNHARSAIVKKKLIEFNRENLRLKHFGNDALQVQEISRYEFRRRSLRKKKRFNKTLKKITSFYKSAPWIQRKVTRLNLLRKGLVRLVQKSKPASSKIKLLKILFIRNKKQRRLYCKKTIRLKKRSRKNGSTKLFWFSLKKEISAAHIKFLMQSQKDLSFKRRFYTQHNFASSAKKKTKDLDTLRQDKSFVAWKYSIRRLWNWRIAKHIKATTGYRLRRRQRIWGRFPLIGKIQRTVRRRTINARKTLPLDPLALPDLNCNNSLQQLLLYCTWFWKKTFRKIAAFCTMRRRVRKNRRFHQIRLEPKFFINNIRYHTTMHPDLRSKLPWLETILYPRSYKTTLFYPHMWRRFRRIMLTKRNKLYKSYMYFLYNRWKPSALRVPSGFFRLNHLFKRVIYPFYGHIKHNALRRIIVKERYKKESATGVLSQITGRFEQNLANTIFRLNWAPSLLLSEWVVREGFVSVNNVLQTNPRMPVREFDLIQQVRPVELTKILRLNWTQRYELYEKTPPAHILVNNKIKAAFICENYETRQLPKTTHRTSPLLSDWICGLQYLT